MKKRRAVPALVLALSLFMGLAGQGTAKIFENLTRGGRALGLGGAYTAGSGSDSLFYNIAGMRSIKGVEAGFSFQPGGFSDDLTTLSGSIVVSLPAVSAGGYLNILTLDGFTTETTVVAGAAIDLPVLKGIFKRFSVGVAARLYLMSKDFTLAAEKGSDSATSVDLGVQAQVGEWFVVALSALNILSPELSYYDGEAGTGEATDREVRVGFRLNLLKEFAVYGDYAFYAAVDSDIGVKGLHLGAEIVFYDVFRMRFGMDEGDLTFGAGIAANYIDVNFALKAKGVLGLYYQAGVVVKL